MKDSPTTIAIKNLIENLALEDIESVEDAMDARQQVLLTDLMESFSERDYVEFTKSKTTYSGKISLIRGVQVLVDIDCVKRGDNIESWLPTQGYWTPVVTLKHALPLDTDS